MEVNKALLEKYYRGYCNDAEQKMVAEWLMRPDAFTGNTAATGSSAAKRRMWRTIRSQTIGNTRRRYFAAAAGVILFIAAAPIIWDRIQPLPDPSSYVVIDNTRSHLLSKQHIGDILLSESANSGWKQGNKDCLLYTNSLIINNQQGRDIWVYLKTSSEKGSGMIKFLCKRKKTYVAGYITEHTTTGNRKYLYSRQVGSQTSLPAHIATSINSQLNAAKINAKYSGYATVII